MIINMIEGREQHLLRQHDSRCRTRRELIVRKPRRSFWLNTVAFFSSRVEELTDVETGGCDVIGETHRSLSDCMNGHRFTTTVSNPELPVAIHTQFHQIPFQECWSVSVIHKLPNSSPDHIRCQFETGYQLVLQSHHIPSLNNR